MLFRHIFFIFYIGIFNSIFGVLFANADDFQITPEILIAGHNQRIANYENLKFTLDVVSNSSYSVIYEDASAKTIARSQGDKNPVCSLDIFKIMRPNSSEYNYRWREFERYLENKDKTTELYSFYAFDGKEFRSFKRSQSFREWILVIFKQHYTCLLYQKILLRKYYLWILMEFQIIFQPVQ